MKPFFSLFIVSMFTLLFSCNTQQEPVENTNELQPLTTFFLVRHAEKVLDGSDDPELTPEGQARAQRLAELLQPNGIEAIYSTSFTRTRNTAAPLATALDLPIQEYDHRAENLAQDLIEANRGKTVLVVGHSNSTPTLVNQLIGKEQFEKLDESVYNKIFIVTVGTNDAKALVLEF